jgi:hypothetical protein
VQARSLLLYTSHPFIPATNAARREPQIMPVEYLPFFLPISVFVVVFASFYISIRMAKKRVVEWKRGSTSLFLRSFRNFGNRGRSIWMKELGYDEAEAEILSEYQTQAVFYAILGGVIVIAIARIVKGPL